MKLWERPLLTLREVSIKGVELFGRQSVTAANQTGSANDVKVTAVIDALQESF